jgi:hypothetical protein
MAHLLAWAENDERTQTMDKPRDRQQETDPFGENAPLSCLEDETDFDEPRYYDVGGQPVIRLDRDSLPVGFLPGGAETHVFYGIWAYTGRRITEAEFAAMRAAQDAGAY